MMPDNENPPLPNPAPPALPEAAPARTRWAGFGFALAVVALVVAAWQVVDTRQRLAELQQEFSRRQAEVDAATLEERGAQRALREQVETLQGKLGAVEGQVEAFDEQAAALQLLYQDISRGREEAALIEVEQAVALAGQQLQLAGNVPAAILALQLAETRLARVDRPLAATLRKSLRADLERLAAVPAVDTAALSGRLEQVLAGVDKLPPAAYGRPRDQDQKAEVPPAANWWARTGGAIWGEIRALIRIQRFDREEPALLAPGQDFLLRENLKLRLLNARLALLSRDQATWRGELKVAGEWLGRHFDSEDKAVQAARAELKQLSGVALAVELPNLDQTRSALGLLRDGKGKK